jgi:hypothetical protein
MAVTALSGDARIQNMIVSYDDTSNSFGLAVEAEYPVPFGYERVTRGLTGLTQTEAGSEEQLNIILGTINDAVEAALGL